MNRIVGNGDIEDVTFQNTEHLGPTADDRRAVFDIAVRTKSGEEYIIEMQLAQQEYFRDRSLFYASYPILNQTALAKEEDELESYCDKWMYLFKNMSHFRERPKVFDEK